MFSRLWILIKWIFGAKVENKLLLGSPYRENYIKNEDIYAKKHEYMIGESTKTCAFCNHEYISAFDNKHHKYFACTPYKRYIVKKSWFTSQKCNIDGAHWHCFCWNCKQMWIVKEDVKIEVLD